MALSITKGMVMKAQKVVVYGPEGIGKSTFAAQFPAPLFIDTEGSTNLMDVARLPRPTSWTMLLAMIQEVKVTPGCCKTLVVDTIDWAEQLCTTHVCAAYQKKSVEEFGYGKGYVYVQEEIGRFLNLLQDVIDAGINVVLTAHAQIRKFEQPNESGSYDRYELKLGQKTSSRTSALVKEWADMVLFAKYKEFVVSVGEKKKVQGGARVMYTTHHPNWDAKNRHSLPEELPFEYAQIAYCIPNDAGHGDQVSAVAARKPESQGQEQKEKKEEMKSVSASTEQERKQSATEQKPPKESKTAKSEVKPKQTATTTPALEDVPKALADLMAANGVTVEEIQGVVAMKGYYPQDTPIANYDPGFIDGVLVGAWQQVFAAIKEMREVPF